MDNLNISQWSVIGEEKFSAMQFDSGMLLRSFNPANPEIPDSDDILCATTGNITITCKPTLVDLGEDVNNLHGKLAELQYISGWECKIGFTALEMSTDTLHLALGAADLTVASGKIQPRGYLKFSDFNTDLWWVGALIGGGFAAVKLTKALNTAGLSLRTSKDGKGNLTVELEGFITFNTQDSVPMEFYALSGDDATLSALTISGVTLSPTFNKNVTTYTATTTNATNTITATATDNSATVQIKNGTTTVNSGSSATWVTGANTVTVTVTNGSATKIYTVNVTKSS